PQGRFRPKCCSKSLRGGATMDGIFSRRSAALVFGVVTSMAVISGCDSDAASAVIRPQKIGAAVENTPPAWIDGDRTILRHRLDASRGRVWTLTAAGVE